MPNVINYPLYTVVVFSGSPTSDVLTESYRRSWDGTPEGRAQAIRYARSVTSSARYDHVADRKYVPPVATVFEDSPSRGIGFKIAEYTSRGRAKYLASLEIGGASLAIADLVGVE